MPFWQVRSREPALRGCKVDAELKRFEEGVETPSVRKDALNAILQCSRHPNDRHVISQHVESCIFEVTASRWRRILSGLTLLDLLLRHDPESILAEITREGHADFEQRLHILTVYRNDANVRAEKAIRIKAVAVLNAFTTARSAMAAAAKDVLKVKVARNPRQPIAGFPSHLVVGVHNDDTTDEETDTESRRRDASRSAASRQAKKRDVPTPAQILVQHGPDELRGRYTLHSAAHNGRPLWRKTRGPQQWILYSSEDEAWYISDELEDQGYDRIEADELSFLPPMSVAFQEGCVLSEVTLLDMQVEPIRTGESDTTTVEYSDYDGASDYEEGSASASVYSDDEESDLSEDEVSAGTNVGPKT